MPVPPLTLDIDWRTVTLFLGTTFCALAAVVGPFVIIARSERMVAIFSRGSPMYLRFVTVVLVVWYGSMIAVLGAWTQGVAAIFGMILGYVFGAVNRPEEAPSRTPEPPPPAPSSSPSPSPLPPPSLPVPPPARAPAPPPSPRPDP